MIYVTYERTLTHTSTFTVSIVAVAEYGLRAVERKQQNVSPANTLKVNVKSAFARVKNVCMM